MEGTILISQMKMVHVFDCLYSTDLNYSGKGENIGIHRRFYSNSNI